MIALPLIAQFRQELIMLQRQRYLYKYTQQYNDNKCTTPTIENTLANQNKIIKVHLCIIALTAIKAALYK